MEVLSVRNTLGAIALAGWSACVLAQNYQVKTLTLGGTSSGAIAINDAGQVTGYADTVQGIQDAFLFTNGVIKDLGTLGGGSSEGHAINDAGQVAGSIGTASGDTQAFLYSNGVTQIIAPSSGNAVAINSSGQVTGYTGGLAFLYSNGVMRSLTAPGFGGSFANAINDAGQVAGEGSTTAVGNPTHAFLYSNGVMQDLGTLGGTYSIGTAVNSSGQVVGYAGTGNGFQHAFLYSNGVMQDLGTFGGNNSATVTSNSINSSGQVVGFAGITDNTTSHAFLYSNGVLKDLGTLGGTYSEGHAINDSGQVVGSARIADETGHAFLYSGGQMADLNSLIAGSPLGSSITLTLAVAINSKGLILSYGNDNSSGKQMGYLLIPPQPTVSPIITGTRGTNGWYVSKTTTLEWAVTGNPAPTTSGCGSVSVPQTSGTTYTCSATNSLGTASDSAIIKEDSVKPSVVIKKPAANAVYSLNQKVLSSYSCLDATSSVGTCTGPVSNGGSINTSTLGQQTFAVTGTDNAGNASTKTVLYSVQAGTATPVFSLKTGTYTGPQHVSITDATAGAVIYYTTNGSTPTLSSRVYASAIAIRSTTTLKARAIASNNAWSAVKSATYTIH